MARLRLQSSSLLIFLTFFVYVFGCREPPLASVLAKDHAHHERHIDVNATLPAIRARSIGKRDASLHCGDSRMASLIVEAMRDAEMIVGNAVKSLNLLQTLFDPATGELRFGKEHQANRLPDEETAFSTYSMFVHRANQGPNHPENKRGFEAIQFTLDVAKTLRQSITAYLANQPIRNSYRLRIHCDEKEIFGDKNWNGLTYTDETGKPNPSHDDYYFLWQDKGTMRTPTEFGQWSARKKVCRHTKDETSRDFGSLKIPTMRAYAYVLTPRHDETDETMTFCKWTYDDWYNHESYTKLIGVHYRGMHVEQFYKPTEDQKTAAVKLVDGRIGLEHVQKYFVTTLIHELTHSKSMVTSDLRLLDIHCAPERTTTELWCLESIAKGESGLDDEGHPQGELDAEAFALFSMAMWMNSVTWYRDYSAGYRADH
ncbi:hypothetical protein PT974_03972 [Cladobotryum mycophilum]|uniref:Lysine-specific metallo-endopeptidase domain-containing protein n=1 Tax=Cladobotryum mycophilum TaxID=491253 RepID=A0ABR0STS2_9HYPO